MQQYHFQSRPIIFSSSAYIRTFRRRLSAKPVTAAVRDTRGLLAEMPFLHSIHRSPNSHRWLSHLRPETSAQRLPGARGAGVQDLTLRAMRNVATGSTAVCTRLYGRTSEWLSRCFPNAQQAMQACKEVFSTISKVFDACSIRTLSDGAAVIGIRARIFG
jgi:hypothetical protein